MKKAILSMRRLPQARQVRGLPCMIICSCGSISTSAGPSESPFDYSVLAQPTEVGPRSFPLTGLIQLSADLRALVLDILRRPPVCKLLSLSAYTPSLVETVP